MSCSTNISSNEDKRNHGDYNSSNELSLCNISMYPKENFPQVTELLKQVGSSEIPNIFLEDWTDQSYYDYHGVYLEDLAGTGIHRIIENHPPCLKINGKAYSKGINIFNYPKSTDDGPVCNEIMFTNCYINEIKLKDVLYENVGPNVIRYEWKRIPNYENDRFPIKYPPSQEQKFYIDSRPSILLPGEKRNFGIGFKSKFTGIYKEDWEFITFPAIHTNKIIFKFRAISTEKQIKQPWNIFQNHLKKLQSENCAIDILNFILFKVFESLPDLKDPDFLDLEEEDEVFLYVNKNLYSYNQNIVSELKGLHKAIFEERWNLNVTEYEDKLLKSNEFILNDNLYKFKKNKLQMIKSDINLLPRPAYKKYNEIFELIGDTMTEIQSSIEKSRQKHGFKPLPPIAQSENLPYYYFPLPRSEIPIMPVKEDSKPSKKTAATTAKTADKDKGGKGGKAKKREYIQLVPKQPLIIHRTEWSPENQDYANDVYNAVYENLCRAIEKIEEYLNPQSTISSKSIDVTSIA